MQEDKVLTKLNDLGHQMANFRREMTGFRKEGNDFRHEMGDFRKEGNDFREEMGNFRQETDKKFQNMDEKFDTLARHVLLLDEKIETKASNERVDQLEERMMVEFDRQFVILQRLDQERLFTYEWVKRIDADVEKVKQNLKLA